MPGPGNGGKQGDHRTTAIPPFNSGAAYVHPHERTQAQDMMSKKPRKNTKQPAPPEAAPSPVQMIPVPAIAEDLWPQGDEADQASLHAAEEVFNHLLLRVKDFQSTLPEDYELGMRLGNFGGDSAVHVRGMGYRNPNIIEFYGLLDGDKQVAVVQHVSQLNFMLLAVPPVAEQEPYRIGFGADI